MDLLPKLSSEFSSQTYWQRFFSNRRTTFEWYGDYNSLCDVFHKYCKVEDKILVTGCGNSKLSEDLYNAGYNSIVNIDNSEVAIKQMIKRNNKKQLSMEYLVMDAKNMTFPDDSFNVVIDKGTLDALFVNDEATTVADVTLYLQEILRVLQTSGRYICISLAQKHIALKLIDFFIQTCVIRVHYIQQEASETNGGGGMGSKLPVFVFVLTKMKMKLPKPFLEVSFTKDTTVYEKMATSEELIRKLLDIQDYSIVMNRLASSQLDASLSIDMWRASNSNEACYTITILDGRNARNGAYAVFIVPQGRETDWLYATDVGRRELVDVAKYKRLAIVTLHRNHTYESMEQIKQELSTRVMDFAPQGMKSNYQVPFLTCGDELGYRKVQHEAVSHINGRYVVEDIQNEDQTYSRRLIFCNMLRFVQSEGRLVNDPSKKQKTKKTKVKVVDSTYLKFEYQQATLLCFSFMQNFLPSPGEQEKKFEFLLIGVGGANLPSFIAKTLKHVRVTCVELDGEMINVAKNWFSLKESNDLKCVVDDGLVFMKQQIDQGVRNFYDVIMFDVACIDEETGVNLSPPLSFVESEVLAGVKDLLKENGVFTINTVVNNESKRKHIYTRLNERFSCCYRCVLERTQNVPVFCMDMNIRSIDTINPIEERIVALQKHITSLHQGKLNANNFNISKYTRNLDHLIDF